MRVRGKLKTRNRLFVGMTLRYPDGDFAGRFQVVRPSQDFGPDKNFDISIPLSDFKLDPSLHHLRSGMPSRLEGLVVESLWCHTLYDQAWLGVTHFEVGEPTD
jgi:hypothetical protein